MLKIVVITAEHQACCDLNLSPQHGQQETQSVSKRRFGDVTTVVTSPKGCFSLSNGTAPSCLLGDNRWIRLIELMSTSFEIFGRKWKSFEFQLVPYRKQVVEQLTKFVSADKTRVLVTGQDFQLFVLPDHRGGDTTDHGYSPRV